MKRRILSIIVVLGVSTGIDLNNPNINRLGILLQSQRINGSNELLDSDIQNQWRQMSYPDYHAIRTDEEMGLGGHRSLNPRSSLFTHYMILDSGKNSK